MIVCDGFPFRIPPILEYAGCHKFSDQNGLSRLKPGFVKFAGQQIWTSSEARSPKGRAHGWARSIPVGPPEKRGYAMRSLFLPAVTKSFRAKSSAHLIPAIFRCIFFCNEMAGFAYKYSDEGTLQDGIDIRLQGPEYVHKNEIRGRPTRPAPYSVLSLYAKRWRLRRCRNACLPSELERAPVPDAVAPACDTEHVYIERR